MKKVLAATVAFNRQWMVEKAITSWLDLVPSGLWDLYIVDNGSDDGTAEWVADLARSFDFVHAILLDKNLGTAVALNLAWRESKEGQHRIKADSDVVVHTHGFLEKMVECLDAMPELGIVGLRRDDLIEHPDHENPWYRSSYRDLQLPSGGIAHLEMVNHAMGTFTMYNRTVTDSFGYLYQMQDKGNVYGFDDSMACYRMMALSFERAFLRGWDDVSVNIDHIDPGEGDGKDERNAEYTLWKQQQAAIWMPRYREIVDQYTEGSRGSFYRAEFDFRVAKDHIVEVIS